MVSVTEQVIEYVDEVEKDIEKLVIIAGKPGCGKSKVMRELAQIQGWKYVDGKTLLTEELLELSPKSRANEAAAIIQNILELTESKVVLLDNTQVFFAPMLKLEPLELLKQLSRKQTIIAAWPGEYKDNNLIYLRNFGTEPVKYDSREIKVIMLK